ncbi:MAG TPA: hypothetical protein VKB18_11175, partial [Gemmatimonadota bacterium]|nr:hypothetical protein [Gemmatimonadota bacterium]
MPRASTVRSSPGFRTALAALAAAAAFALGACGGSSSPPTGQNPPPGGGGPNPSADVVVDMQNIAFKTPNGTDSITV